MEYPVEKSSFKIKNQVVNDLKQIFQAMYERPGIVSGLSMHNMI